MQEFAQRPVLGFSLQTNLPGAVRQLDDFLRAIVSDHHEYLSAMPLSYLASPGGSRKIRQKDQKESG